MKNLKKRLKQPVARRGHSTETKIRDALSEAVGEKGARKKGLGSLIVSHFAGKDRGIDFDIPEWRGENARPARFRK
jgi:plasmid stability protein